MKLIDMLVEDGLNGWKWPDGIGAITQDNGSSIYKGVAFGYAKKPYLKGNIWLANNGTGHVDARIKRYDVVADDWSTAIITREQYEAALAAKNEGWIDWPGGECPVPRGTLVDVKWRDGRIDDGIPAKISHDLDSSKRNAISWLHHGNSHDIIAYRLHQPQEVAQTDAEQEANLNECIGQDAAPVWNGEGVTPPVGCECQYRKHKRYEQSEWFNGVVKYSTEFTVVIQPACYPGETVGHPANFEFRPIRSAEDEKRDDRASAIDGFISGFRGQETGSNKELAYALTDYLALLDKL